MQPQPADAPQSGAPSGTTSHQLRALLAMVGVALLLNYVETMIIPGILTIQTFFSTTEGTVAWVTSAFLIVGSAVSPLFGKWGDSYGKKRMFLVALVFYTAGVGMGGFSPSIYFLIAARAVQGIGFAIVPLALAIIAETFPNERIAAAQGVVSATFAIGAAAGLIGGAYIIQDFGWQWAFHSAFILSLILFAAVAKFLPRGSPGTGLKVGYETVVLLMAGVSLVLLYLTEGPYEGWYSTYGLAALAAGIALTAGFFVAESRRSNPLIQLSLLRIRNVLVANGIGIISGIGLFMLFFAVTFYAEDPKPLGLGLDPISAGLTIGPAAVLMLIAGPLIGRLVTKAGPKPALVTGGAVAIVGFSLFIFNRATATDVVIATSVSMVGAVAVIIPIVNMISVSLPRETVATGLGLNTMLRNIGGAIGPVVATSIMATYTATVPVLHDGFLIPVSFPDSTAFDYVFYLGIVAMFVAILFSLATRNYVFRKQPRS
ncbi:MAG: MFS transporter [Nitrososphaerota archaeon]|nr:MFS transporter [Nitrososphaerota archaeon]MDG7025336.1 MFS transporter [Nitrososphaerota archaeon]